jgi:Aerotolerance regulator N-terminal/von Willebrand factor type A domain
MSFLTPLFLVGLAGVAIPVLLHLIQRERRNVVQFPSLMFLRRIPYQSVRRRRIRHWLLLAMRLAALTLVVLAFARPFMRRNTVAAAADGAREVVVLLDRSYSMGYGDHWQRALSAARDAVNGLRPSDRGSIVFFSSNADVGLRSTSDRGRLLASLARVEAGAGGTRYGPALKLAGSILSESPLPRREAILISDFQRVGWQGAEGVRLPDGAVLTTVPVTDASAPNLSATPVSLQRSMFSDQERVTVTAGVANHGSEPVRDVDLALEVGGRAIQTKRLSIEGNGAASTTFDPVTLAERNVRATVRIANDALVRDNVFHFVVSPEEPIRIVLAERSGAPRDASLYLSRALAVGEAPRFEVTTRQADSLSSEELSRAAVIVLNDAAIAPNTAERLGKFVEGGGGLFLVLGERATWSGGADLLPGTPGPPVDRTAGSAARLGALEYGHPVFEVFRAPRSGDFAAARFYGYRTVTLAAGAQVLARFDDGAAALLERRVGAGHVLMWTSSLDTYWNDFAVKPVFLPMVHRIMRHLAGYHEPKPWRTVGEVLEPPDATRSPRTPAGRVAVTPSGQRIGLDAEGVDVLELTEQGFYEIRAQGKDADPAIVVASNVDLAESDMTALDPKEVVAAAIGRAGGSGASGAETPPTDEAQEGVQRVWWYLLFAGVLLMGAETIVANRLTV